MVSFQSQDDNASTMTRYTSRNTWRIAEYKNWCESGFPRTPVVKHLVLEGAGIKYLSLFISRLPNLETIDVSRNKLTVLPYTLWTLQYLNYLNISHNQIHSLGVPKISHDSPGKCLIKYLDIYEKFGDLRQEMPYATENKMQDGPLCSGGILGHPLNGLGRMRSLIANNNLLQDVPDIATCPLRVVDFSDNLLTKFPKIAPVFTHLSIHGNKINTVFSPDNIPSWYTSFPVVSIDESMTDATWLSIEWDTETSKSVVVPGTNKVVCVYKST